jgi:acid phosphatase type 7
MAASNREMFRPGFPRAGLAYRLVALLALLTAVVAPSRAQAPAATWQPDLVLAVPPSGFSFVGYGDMRATDPANTVDSNVAVRRAEIARIAQENPTFAVISGDLVLTGADPNDWRIFAAENRPLHQAGIELLPALGNHDVRGVEAVALSNYFRQFPQLGGRRWYSVRAANVLFFVLDSNSPDRPGTPQWQWLEKGLSTLPPDIEFALLVLHHPPLTHSGDSILGGGHAARPPEQQLAAFLEEQQKKLQARIIVFAGHVHNYERYVHGGVTYIVSGGGGATPYMVPRTKADFYQEPGPTYHICNFSVEPGKLHFQMVKLTFEGTQAQWTVKDSFTAHASAAAGVAPGSQGK